MAFPSGYTSYDEYVVQSSKVDDDLADFPVYVDLSDLSSQFWSTVRSDGGDIRVTLDDGTTQLPVEVVTIDTGGETGEIHFKASSLSASANTTFRIWVNGSDAMPAADSTYGSEAVWSDYGAVWHLDEDPSGTAPQAVDATGNGNDLTSSGSMTDTDEVAGRLGNGWDFDGSNDYASGSASFTGDTEGTVSAWLNRSGGSDTWLGVSDLGSNNNFLSLGCDINGKIAGRLKTTVDQWEWVGTASETAIPTSSMAFTAFTIGSGGNAAYLWDDDHSGAATPFYADGSSSSTEWLDDLSNLDTVAIGARRIGSTGQFWGGVIDEVRIRSSAVSSSWLITEYANQSDHSTWAVVTAKTSGASAASDAPFSPRPLFRFIRRVA